MYSYLALGRFQLGGETFHYVQVGISSYSATNCSRERPSVFTRVSAYMPWIESTLKK